jgi:hypothetical protein
MALDTIGKLITGVTGVFGDAFDLIKMGAQVYGALSGDDDEDGSGFMKPDFARFRTSAARPQTQNMQQPFGLRPPIYPENVQNAMRSMAERQLSDNNLQQVRDTAAIRRSGRFSSSPTVNLTNDMSITPAGARQAQISRARIRQTMGV